MAVEKQPIAPPPHRCHRWFNGVCLECGRPYSRRHESGSAGNRGVAGTSNDKEDGND